MSNQLTHPLHYCLQQRASHLGHPTTWDWVLRDPVVGCFAPALSLLADDGLIELDDTLRQTSQDLYWHTAAHWVRRERQLKPNLNKLAAAGIPVIPLKGAALLETTYPSIGLRNMVDVDILVRQADYIPAAQILLAHGLQPKWDTDADDLFPFTQLPSQFWPGELSFRGQDGLHIDLHRDLVTYHWFKTGFPVDITQVWARTIEPAQPEASLWKLMLSPYDMLGHLCLHLALHGLGIVKNFFDVDQFLRNLPNDWDWDRYLVLADAWQLHSVSYHVFTFCQQLFNTPVPERVMDALAPNCCNRWMVRRLITTQAILANRPTLGKRYPSLVKFALFDNTSIKIKTITNLLFPKKSLLKYNPIYQSLCQHWAHLLKVIWRGD